MIRPVRRGRSTIVRGVMTLWALTLPLGCVDPGSRGVVVTTENGIPVRTSPDIDLPFTELDPEPELSIGGANASGPEQLFQVQNILIDANGRLWVADGQSAEIRIFGGDGTHWRTLGGRGEGPGEFVQIRLLGIDSEGSVLVGDGRTNRITVFDPEGELVATRPVPAVGDAPPRPFGVFPADGSILGQVPRVIQAASLEPGQTFSAPVELVRLSWNEASVAWTEVARVAHGPTWIWTGRAQVPLPFTVNALFEVASETVLLTSGPRFRIRAFREGEPVEVFGVDRPPRAVSPESEREYRAFVDTYIPEESRPEYLAALDHEELPEALPTYDRILSAPGDHVWAQVYEVDPLGPHTWDVYGPDREFVGQVEVPSGFRPLAIRDDRIAGVWRDELGTEHVQVYALR